MCIRDRVARTPVSQYPEELQKHAEWAEDILARHPELNGDTVHLIPVSYTHL